MNCLEHVYSIHALPFHCWFVLYRAMIKAGYVRGAFLVTTDRYLTYKCVIQVLIGIIIYLLVLTEAISESLSDHKSRSTMYILLSAVHDYV